MNLLSSKIARQFTKLLIPTLLFIVFSPPLRGFEVDMSRRVEPYAPSVASEVRWPASLGVKETLLETPGIQDIFKSVDPAQSIVVLHTEEGFLPDTIRVRKDGNYKIVVVNVNEKFKNSSFLLDAFGQTLGTYFGKPIKFNLEPKVNGIFTFLSAETGYQGKIVVFTDKDNSSVAANMAPAP